MKKINFSFIIPIMLIISGCSAPPIEQSLAYQIKNEIWNTFREQFKYHIQLIGTSFQKKDQSCVFLISEPPQHTIEDGFKELLNDYNIFTETKQKKVGYDGWVKDILILVNEVDSEDIEIISNKLNQYVFNTLYKAKYFELPIKNMPPFLTNNLNFQISASELNKWFVEDSELFYFQNDSLNAKTIPQILSSNQDGIHYSQKPGFVLWVIAQNSDISNRTEDIRKFTLDADLILGAISNDNELAIIGRERSTHLLDLPPLRTETILLLASANKNELSQSYERNHFFAGKLQGGKDWAPIYLSDELINTEYGSLLNITDQMLKSWSLNGNIDYVDFPYTKPDYYAFKNDVMKELNVSTLTFNWNTKGAAYSVKMKDYAIVALNRTGSLPVSYIPEGMEDEMPKSVPECEKNAYDFFSTLNNPYLARVVQYATLYQIFSAYNISSLIQTNDHPNKPSDLFQERIQSILMKIKNFDKIEIDKIAARIFEGNYNQLKKNDELYAQMYGLFKQEETENISFKLDTLKSLIEAIYNDLGEAGIAKYSHFIANPRSSDFSSQNDTILLYLAHDFSTKYNFIKNNLSLFNTSIDEVANDYVFSYSNCFNNWIKTASIVLSWSKTDSATSTGGHNLDSRVIPFRIDKTLKRGEYKLVEENGIKKVLVSEYDLAKITPQFLRKVEDIKSFGKQFFKDALEIVPRQREAVIASSSRPRGLSQNHMVITDTPEGILFNNKKVTSCNELIDEMTLYASESKDNSIVISFENFSMDRAKAIVKSSQIKLEGELFEGSILNINKTKYDFSKARLICENNGDITISLVRKFNKPNSKFKITLKGISQSLKSKVMDISNMLYKRAQFENINFYKELKNELKRQNINIQDKDILIEIQDCIISDLIKIYNNGWYC